MRTLSGLVVLVLCAYGLYLLTFATQPTHTTNATPRSRPSENGNDSAIGLGRIRGEYQRLLVELGILEAIVHTYTSPSLSSSSSVSDASKDASLDPLNNHRLDLDASSISGVRDESWHHLGLRKMRRRTPTFGLWPHLSHPSVSTSGRRNALHFAIDSIREPRSSATQIKQEYAQLAVQEDLASAARAAATSTAARGHGHGHGQHAKGSGGRGSKKSQKKVHGHGHGRGRQTAPRVVPGKRPRGGRRLPSRVEH